MEHISIEINKDFGGFKNNFCLGFTLTETLCIMFATLCCGATVLPLCLLLHIDVFIAGYIGMVPTGFILFLGFYKKNGMDAKEYFAKSKALKNMKKLHYESEENPENIIMLMKEEEQVQSAAKDTKDTQDSWNLAITKYKKRAKIAFGAIVVTMFLCAAGMFAFHFVKNKELSNIKKSEISTEITKKESKETSKSSTELTDMTTKKTISPTKKEKKTENRPSDSSTTARRSNSTVTQRSETTQARPTTAQPRPETKTEKKKPKPTTEKRKSTTEKKKPTKPKPNKPTKPATEKPKPNFNVDYDTN